jgi:hypothetical protein
MVLASILLSRDQVGFPLHLLDGNFEITRSFGASDEKFDVRDQLKHARALTLAGPEQVWAAHLFEYVIELWSISGTRVGEIRRTAGWLPDLQPRRPWRRGEPLPPPRPGITSIQSDADGYVWVLGRVLDENWKPPRLEPVPGGAMLRAIDDQPDDQNYDTMIEVIDGQTGRLVASMRHAMAFNQFAGSRILVHRDQFEDGRMLISLYDLGLAAPTSISQGAQR